MSLAPGPRLRPRRRAPRASGRMARGEPALGVAPAAVVSLDTNRTLWVQLLRGAVDSMIDFNPKIFHQKFIIRDAGPPPGWYDPNNRRPPCPANMTRSSGRASSPLSTPFSNWSSPASSATSTTRSWSSVTRASRSSSGCATRRPRAWTTRRWLGSTSHRWAAIRRSRSASSSTHKHDISQILQEALEHERATLRIYYTLLDQVRDKSVWLEEYAREQIQLEEQHIAEVEK